jgi:hypothetical protein
MCEFFQGKFRQSSSIAQRLNGLDIVLLLLIVALGIMRLPEPLGGDQALFVVGSKAIASGQTLYHDFWEDKPPGIYGFVTLAGLLFGFNEIGVHCLDLFWMIGLALALRMTWVDQFRQRWIAQILPYMVVGGYFCMINFHEQMQVEALIGLPLYLVVWFLAQATQGKDRRLSYLVKAGLMGGIVMLLKIVYVPLLLALWCFYWLHGFVQRREKLIPAIYQSFLPLLLGVSLILGPVLCYLAMIGTLDDAFGALFVFPAQFLKESSPQPFKIFIWSAKIFFYKCLPLCGLAAIGSWFALHRRNFLTSQMFIWMGVGLAMIFTQKLSWWSYHFYVFLVPLNFLAALGIDRLLQRRQWWGKLIVLTLMVGLILGNGSKMVLAAQTMVRSQFNLSESGQRRYQAAVSPYYKAAIAETAFLSQPNSRPGPIYVMGNPIFYLMADRAQATSMNMWSPEIFLANQWAMVARQINEAQPPYIFVDTRWRNEYIPASFYPSLDSRYRLIRQSEAGSWYEFSGQP